MPPAATARAWPDRLSPVAAGIVAVVGVILLLGTLVFACLVPWLVVLSLATFLAGPNAAIPRLPAGLAVLSLPPLGGALTLLVWLSRRVRVGDLLRTAEPALRPGTPRDWIGPRLTLALLAAGCLGFAAFARLVFLYARIQGAIDEGLYLYAARLSLAGQVPYRDFYFDQAPLLPYAFGVALAPFHYDEVAARLFAIGCTLLTLLVTFGAAVRLGGRLAGVLAFGLLLSSVDFIGELSGGIQSNGGLTALTAALVALALAYDRLGLALALASIAAGLRQLFLPLPLLLACYVALGRKRTWLGLLGGMVPSAVLYGVFLTVGGPAAPLALVRPLRQPEVVRMTVPPDFTFVLAEVSTTLQRVLGAYTPLFVCAGPVAYLALRRGHPRAPALLVLAASSTLLLIVNLLAYPSDPRYPVTQLPLAAVLGGVSFAALLERLQRDARAALMAGLALLLIASPLNAYRDANFVELFHDHPPLERFLAAAAYVRAVAPPDGTLVTLETPFASQTGLRLPRGLEAGSWGVYAGITPERARQLGVVTYPMLVDLVEQGVGDVVISSDRYGFVDNYANTDEQKRRLERALEARYDLTETFGNVSDWGNVRVWVRRRLVRRGLPRAGGSSSAGAGRPGLVAGSRASPGSKRKGRRTTAPSAAASRGRPAPSTEYRGSGRPDQPLRGVGYGWVERRHRE
jgi:hypothetical protein